MSKTTLDQSDRNRINVMLKMGYPQDKIALSVGVSRYQVQKLAKALFRPDDNKIKGLKHSMVIIDELAGLDINSSTINGNDFNNGVWTADDITISRSVNDKVDLDEDIVAENVKLAKKVLRLQDTQRIERKYFRESSRVDNALVEVTRALNETLLAKKFDADCTKWKIDKSKDKPPVGVIHFTDHHLNEIVNDLQSNKFDIHIASKRIQKHVHKSLRWFQSHGVHQVLLAMTGDMIKNNQFISEITEMATSRAHTVLLAVEIYSQVIQHINLEGFNVTIASVIGNESRMNKDFDTTDFLASDSFDLMIHKLLQTMFRDKPGVSFVPMTNPLECVVNLNGLNLLLVHGNVHGRLSGTGTIEKATAVIKSRYAASGTRVDYLISGHIHSAYMSDNFARASSIVGSNSYSERQLGLTGKASQNAFMFYEDGTIDGIKNDLDKTEGYSGYNIDPMAKELIIDIKTTSPDKGNMKIISSYTI